MKGRRNRLQKPLRRSFTAFRKRGHVAVAEKIRTVIKKLRGEAFVCRENKQEPRLYFNRKRKISRFTDDQAAGGMVTAGYYRLST